MANYALKSEIPDISNLASKSEIPSLDGYAKTSDIPSVDGLASETFVTNKLDGYIKKSDVSSAAKTAIVEINSSEDIAGIQAAMVKFLQTLVIPEPTPAP